MFRNRFYLTFSLIVISAISFFYLNSAYLHQVKNFISKKISVEKIVTTIEKKEVFLESICLNPTDFLLSRVPDKTMGSLLKKIPQFDLQYKKISNGFSFGVGIQCPSSNPIVLRFKVPKNEALKFTKNNIFLATIKTVFSEKELTEPKYELPLYWVKNISEKKDYVLFEFEIFKTEAKNPYFVVFTSNY